LDHLKLLNLLKHMGSNPSEISGLILTNPDFSAKILQTVNSAYFGFPEKIISVGRAITLLGYNNVRSLVLQDYINALVPDLWQKDDEILLKIWIHSACVAVCASYLSRQVFRIAEYDFGAIGLLHDIGKYFLPTLDIQGDAALDQPSIIQEEQRYGINHALMGSIIAEKWELSDLILNGIKYHHHPFFFSPETIPETFAKPAFVMAISDLMTKVLGYPGNETELFPILDDYYRKYNLKPDLKEIINPFLVKEMDKARKTVLSYSQKPMEGES
jgi:HD-like signal output (HDOD) protein